MCPGADDETLSIVLPILRKVAAQASDGSPCVGAVGTGGAGHYCKMIHNGIEYVFLWTRLFTEIGRVDFAATDVLLPTDSIKLRHMLTSNSWCNRHGMMAAISEAWGIMRSGLDMTENDIADEFERWNANGELKNTFLVKIGVDICRTIDKKTDERVLDTVEDKVVQDFTGEEGTGIWSNTEAVTEHVAAPTLSTAHYLRIASGDLDQRRRTKKAFGTAFSPQSLSVSDGKSFLESLRLAVYVACLAAYVQGMNIIEKANEHNHFNVNYTELLQVWRAGCIIQADYINRDLLTPIYSNQTDDSSSSVNPLYQPTIADEFKKGYSSLKSIVSSAVQGDHIVPALSATLEYLKHQTSTDLPTSFYEAELDYFGKHMYDKKGDDPEGKPVTGKHHYEWKPA